MTSDIRPSAGQELGPGDPTEGETGEDAAWDRLAAAFRAEEPTGAAPPWLEERIMAEIQSLPARGPMRRLGSWLLQPQPIRIPPLAVGLAAAGLATVLLLPAEGPPPEPPQTEPAAADAGETPTIFVQFSLEAPGASSVAVAGDFSGWEPDHPLSDPDGDGVWTGRIPVLPGVHTYMFVVNGSEWVTDPRAERYQDDGFGNRNAVLAVTRTSL